MIDPITLSAAVTGATTAYNAIKKAIMVGKEIEDMSSELGRWMTAVSDVDNVHKNANNPTTFDKLFNGSIEQVAIESFSAKKKLQKQREELKNFLVAHYGLQAWDDLIKEEKRLERAYVRTQAALIESRSEMTSDSLRSVFNALHIQMNDFKKKIIAQYPK